MKRAIIWASAVVLLAGVLTLNKSAWSQNDTAPAPSNLPHKVGLIDMAHVFKNYEKFEALRKDLKDEITVSEEKAKGMQAELVTMQNNLKNNLKEGSPEYSKAEQEIVKKAAEFEGFRRTASRDFLKKESQIYLQVYNETSEAVRKYADFFKYTLVIRFNREPLDTENPQNLLQGMNRQVVHHRAEDDITESVLKYLNDKYKRSTGGAAATAPKTATPKSTGPR